MNIFEGIRVGCSWRVTHTRALTPWEYLCTVSATVVQSQFGYSVEFLLKNGVKTTTPLSTKCYSDDIEGTVLDLHTIKIITLELNNQTIYRIEF